MTFNSEAQQIIQAQLDEYAKQRAAAMEQVNAAQQALAQAARQVDALDGAIQALSKLLADTPKYKAETQATQG